MSPGLLGLAYLAVAAVSTHLDLARAYAMRRQDDAVNTLRARPGSPRGTGHM
jgi:hypothetical protein